MSQIRVDHLTFYYEGSPEAVFEQASFSIDTDWKLGFIGRNGKGKTTFLRLLMGEMEYRGVIQCGIPVDYFPYTVSPQQEESCGVDLLEDMKPGCELWRVLRELDKLKVDPEVLYRPYRTLSHGERTKVMLAVLFSGEHDFLLIDEPTNHLDAEARELVKWYLRQKKGFILVSHDRDLLDACVDHVLVLNRQTIEVQSGNFSTWWENKSRKDACSRMENEKHLREIAKLRQASERTRQWADKNERTKIGFDPKKEPDRCISTRSYIGAKTKKMQSRVKQMSSRIDREIEEKEGLLVDIEDTPALKLMPLQHHKEVLVSARQYSMRYSGASRSVFQPLDLELRQGERVFLHGANGCGKSSLIRAILAHSGTEQLLRAGAAPERNWLEEGTLTSAAELVISYVNQDTSFLRGSLRQLCERRGLEESLLCSILRSLGMEREQFAKPMEEYSQGQKKKVLIASSLLTPAHLYIWDEPLNYMDVFSRMQIEQLILSCQPTMLVVDHDVRFRERIATEVVEIKNPET